MNRIKKPALTLDASDIICLLGIGVIEWGLYNLNLWWAVIVAGALLFRIGARVGGRK